MALATLVTGCSVLVGVPLGILLGKTDLPLRRSFTVLFVIPLLIPPYIIAVSWSDLLGREGLLAQLLGSDATTATALWLFGLPGCTFVLFSIFLPIPMLLTMVFLRTVNPRLEEAGRLVSGWRGVMTRITLPLILPGVLLSAMLDHLSGAGGCRTLSVVPSKAISVRISGSIPGPGPSMRPTECSNSSVIRPCGH